MILCFSALAKSDLPTLNNFDYWPLQYHAAFEDDETIHSGSEEEKTVSRPQNYFDQQMDRARNPLTTKDWDGLVRDAQYFVLYQVAFVGILYFMPESISKWSDDQKKQDRIQAYKDHITHIQFDNDLAAVNYIGHPYFGATYYVRAIERGYDAESAFLYSATMSTIYEFGVEAMFEEASIQDLFVTPILGSVLGYFFVNARDNIRQDALARGKFTGYEKFVLGFTDPLGWVNSYTDRLFQKDVDVALVPGLQLPPQSFQVNSKGDYVRRARSTALGVQLTVRW